MQDSRVTQGSLLNEVGNVNLRVGSEDYEDIEDR